MDKPVLIQNAALRLFVTQGFHGTPTSKIAQEAGVSNGTLFHYYKTKEELVVALYNAVKENLNTYLLERLETKTEIKGKFKSIFVNSLRWAMENPDQFYYIQQMHFSPHMALVPNELIHQQSKLHIDLINQGINERVFKPLPADFIFSLCSSHVYGLWQYLMQTELPEKEQKQMIKTAFNLLWDGLT